MRMRRKKHLEERLSFVSDYLVVTEREIANVNDAILDKRLLNFKEIFGNDNPIFLEIGCGKGSFVCQMALENPNINFLAVEMLNNIILMACENAKNYNLKNVKFLNTGAEYLLRYIDSNSISAIYLNFSPPYPKKSYENRRLTNDRYLNTYREMLVNGGLLKQRTDDIDFFNYSIEKLKANNFDVKIDEDIPNILTEYEQKFISLNIKINRLTAIKK